LSGNCCKFLDSTPTSPDRIGRRRSDRLGWRGLKATLTGEIRDRYRPNWARILRPPWRLRGVSICFLFSVAHVYTGWKRRHDQRQATGPVGERKPGRDFLARERGWQSNRALAPKRSGKESPVVLDGQAPCQLSPAPQQIHNRASDGRCHAVPARDQIVECLILPARFRPATRFCVVTTVRIIRYVNSGAGAILAASTSSEHASTGDKGRQNASKPLDHEGVASHENRPVLRQRATANDRPRPTSATESATGPLIR
jgi:hypothetical protein